MRPTETPPGDVPFVPVGEGEMEATVFRCALCGMKFTHGEQVCGACPLSAGCDLVRCPGCGYQFPRSSKTVELLRRLFRRERRRRP